MSKFYIAIIIACCAFTTASKGQSQSFWKKADQSSLRIASSATIQNAQYYSLALDELIKSSTQLILIPYPDGSLGEFRLEQVPVMSPKLAKKYPEIKTFKGRNIANGDVIRLIIATKVFMP